MNKENIYIQYIYNRILLNHKKTQNIVICVIKDGARGY